MNFRGGLRSLGFVVLLTVFSSVWTTERLARGGGGGGSGGVAGAGGGGGSGGVAGAGGAAPAASCNNNNPIYCINQFGANPVAPNELASLTSPSKTTTSVTLAFPSGGAPRQPTKLLISQVALLQAIVIRELRLAPIRLESM